MALSPLHLARTAEITGPVVPVDDDDDNFRNGGGQTVPTGSGSRAKHGPTTLGVGPKSGPQAPGGLLLTPGPRTPHQVRQSCKQCIATIYGTVFSLDCTRSC